MHVTKAIKKWGNSYGIALTKAELEELGLRPGDEVHARLEKAFKKRDVSKIPTFHWGGDLTPDEVDRIVEEETWRDHVAGRGR